MEESQEGDYIQHCVDQCLAFGRTMTLQGVETPREALDRGIITQEQYDDIMIGKRYMELDDPEFTL